ncbi:MAG: right-handed parallel beta-helix repeat-containing protein [Ruminococcus sp.]|nr:right-handed parallel beta-helix repeat-containing protein [Ruminococcus sp.]
MQITIDKKNYFATVDTLWLAMQGECNTRRVSVDAPEVQGAANYFLRAELPDMTIYDMQIVNNQVILSNAVTQFSGIVKLQWIAKDGTGGLIAKSQVIDAIVKDSIDGDTSAIPTPEEMKTKYDEYMDSMQEVQQDVTKKSETAKADADRAESSVSRAEALLQSMQGLTIGERVRLYVDAETGSDTNNGKATTTAVQTIDRALVLANAYQQAIICLKKGQTYTATDKSNEYGMGIQLYHRTLRFEAYGTASDLPKIQNAIFAYNCNLEWKGIDLTGNSSVFTMYNTIANFENCSFYWVESRNSFAQVRLCDIQREWVQYGGFSVISNAESQYRHIGGIQANQGARIDYSGPGIGAYGNDGCSVLTIYGIPEKLRTAKNIAEGSIETKTVYVNAATGSDARDGTSQAKALLTMSRALQFTQYAKKAVIYLAAGTYPIPNKTLTLLGRDVRIYGNAAATTTIQGNFVCENGFLHLSKVTIDNTDSDTANTSTTAILAQYNGTVRISDCVVNANSKNAVGVSDISNICCSGTEFKGNAQYAVYVTGQGDAKIYSCTNSTTKSIYSGANSMVRITQSNESDFPYTNANNGMVFVNGQQVLPKTTAVTSNQATSSD